MIRAALAAAALALAACQPGPSNRGAAPSDYEVRLAVTPAPEGGVQRLDLPAEALAALRSPDRDDIRVFDGQNAPLTMALMDGGAAGGVEQVRLEALPILGPAGTLGGEAMELRVQRQGGETIVTTVEAGEAPAAPVTLGYLLDTRAIAGRAINVRLDASLPAQQPVDILVEASENLTSWTPVGGRTLYRRTTDAAGALGPEAIELDDGDLNGRYLRVTWSSRQRLLAPVEIRSAEITVETPGGDRRVAIATTTPRRVGAHDIRFSLPAAARLDAVAIAPAAGEALLPVRVLGRNAVDQPWALLGTGDLRAPTPRPVELEGGAFREYRIEVDRRTAGFAAPPRLSLLYRPASLIVLFEGAGPYTLAAGAAGAERRYLEPDKLIPGYRRGAEAGLPAATVAASPNPRVTLPAQGDGRASTRELALWGLLLLGVAVLGLMVWRLWPRRGAGGADLPS